MRSLLRIVVLALAVVAGVPAAAGAIVSGQPADITEVPWQVAVFPDGFLCGGTVIDATHVMTAAHCTLDGATEIPAEKTTVVAGTSNIATYDAGHQQRAVVEVVRHPDYVPGTTEQPHDFAILTLAAPLDLSGPRVRAIALGDAARLDLWDGMGADRSTVSGWGVTVVDPGDADKVSEVLRKVDIAVQDDVTCATFSPTFAADLQLCGGGTSENPSADTCSGDSGGPAAVLDGDVPVLAGVTSYGGGFVTACADPTGPGVYGEVAGLGGFLSRLAPTTTTEPTISGTATVGETLTCDPGTWTQQPAFAFEWLRVDAPPAVALPSDGGPTYVLRAEDAGISVVCRVTAATAGGSGQRTSRPAGPVAAPAPPLQPTPAPSGTPAPQPPPQPIAADHTRPRVAVGRARCTAKRCDVRIRVTDPEPSSGLRPIEIRLRRTVPFACRRGGRRTMCMRRAQSLLVARRSGRYMVVSVARPKRGISQIVVLAQDVAGNRPTPAAQRTVPRRAPV